MSSNIPSWQISTAHVQPFRGARDLVFCLKVPLDSLLVWASSGGSGETARMRRLAWTFAARICDKYQIRLTRSILNIFIVVYKHCLSCSLYLCGNKIWYDQFVLKCCQTNNWACLCEKRFTRRTAKAVAQVIPLIHTILPGPLRFAHQMYGSRGSICGTIECLLTFPWRSQTREANTLFLMIRLN